MKTKVVCGMLGAGKTTFIRNLVTHSDERTVVLVNDFGKAGIDGEILNAGGIESIELPSGCVCCTLRFDLITTIQQIRERLSPERLVVEPSGLASPSGVLEVIASLGINPVTVICVIDPREFIDVYDTQMYGTFFEDQVRNADIVLINKIDLADAETTDHAESIVADMNPTAITFRTINTILEKPLPEVGGDHANPVNSDAHIDVESISLEIERGVSFSTVEDLFDGLTRGLYGKIARAKALVQTDNGPYRFDLSGGRVDITPFEKNIEKGRIVVIGQDLTEIRSRIS